MKAKNSLVLALSLAVGTALAYEGNPAPVGHDPVPAAPAAQCEDALQADGMRQIRTQLFGADLARPSPESAIGQYIAETGAKIAVRSFARGPGYEALGPGEPRLVVQVSEASWAAYARRFHSPQLFKHVHNPFQGTLHVEHNGRYGSYASLSYDMRCPSVGTIMPTMIFSPEEGAALTRFFSLAANGLGFFAQYPWELKDAAGNRFCPQSGYNSCTHWVANIPVGWKRVSRFRVPGKVDQYAAISISNDPAIDAAPREGELRAYVRGNLPGGVQLSDAQFALLQSVYEVPAREQLAGRLDAMASNDAGEFANPGWVAYTLLGRVRAEFVPIVFMVVDDHTRDVPEVIDLQIRAY